MTLVTKNTHWRLERGENDILWLAFDKAGTATNVLSASVLDELGIMLKEIGGLSDIRGLIIFSAKKNGFIAGADIKEFSKLDNVDQALLLISRGQSVFGQLENLPYPTVCVISGFCLGGGLELALACRYRVAEESTKTRLGLPEVQLGIHPGFGGTVRLTRLIGAPAAMDLMLSGKTIDFRKAKKLGIVDLTAPARHLKAAGEYCITHSISQHVPSFLQKMSNNDLVRPLLAHYLKRQVKKRVSDRHYPAPYAMIDLWSRDGGNAQRMFQSEAKSVATLITGDTARNLVKVFFLREQLKSLGKATPFHARHVHVIGAGTMGGDIAAWCVVRGLSVTIQDREPRYIAPAMNRAYRLFKKRLKDPRLIQDAMDRFCPDINGEKGLAKADVVIEAVFENIEVKQGVFKEIESRVRKDALLATNTSSIPLEKVSQALKRPERLVGVHFFNPVAKMPLVEIVTGTGTSPEEVNRAIAFTRQIDRLPLPVKSGPGFLVNRVLMPYLMEAMLLVQEGTSIEAIDKAAVAFGMPMGPILLADSVGLDICLHVAEILAEDLSMTVPEKLRTLVQDGHVGKKSGKGFYQYEKGKPSLANTTYSSPLAQEITDRLILSMTNEAVACLEEGVVESTDLLDAGIIFGTGFAPFRGGPLNHSRSIGIASIQEKLKSLEKLRGERFRPHSGWKNLL